MALRSGYRLGRNDTRDFIFSTDTALIPAIGTSFQIQHDVSVVNQGLTVPCCVSVAVTTCLEVLDHELPGTRLSFMYNYYWARRDRRYLSELDIRQGMNAAITHGICRITFHNVPLNKEGALIRPNTEAIADGKTRCIKFNNHWLRWAYERFNNSGRVDAWRFALASGFPVVLGFDLTSAYDNIPDTNNTHAFPENEAAYGGHAVVAMGYDDQWQNGAFYIRDSRGSQFGDNGYWWLPYELAESHLIIDSWTVHEVT